MIVVFQCFAFHSVLQLYIYIASITIFSTTDQSKTRLLIELCLSTGGRVANWISLNTCSKLFIHTFTLLFIVSILPELLSWYPQLWLHEQHVEMVDLQQEPTCMQRRGKSLIRSPKTDKQETKTAEFLIQGKSSGVTGLHPKNPDSKPSKHTVGMPHQVAKECELQKFEEHPICKSNFPFCQRREPCTLIY